MIAMVATPSYAAIRNEQFPILAQAAFWQKGRSRPQENAIFDDSKDTTALWREEQAGSGPGFVLSPS